MPATEVSSDGEVGRADFREAKGLIAYCRALGIAPLVVSVGDVRLELSPVPLPKPGATARNAPPTLDDSNRLVREYGGAALAEALGEIEELSMEPSK